MWVRPGRTVHTGHVNYSIVRHSWTSTWLHYHITSFWYWSHSFFLLAKLKKKNKIVNQAEANHYMVHTHTAYYAWDRCKDVNGLSKKYFSHWTLILWPVAGFQMYGRYTQELGVYAKEEAARLRESGPRRSVSDRSRTLDLLEYDKGRCAKCRSKFRRRRRAFRTLCFWLALIKSGQVHYKTAALHWQSNQIKTKQCCQSQPVSQRTQGT